MIRFATEADIPDLVQRGNDQGIEEEIENDDAAAVMAGVIRHPLADIIISPKGAIGLELQGLWFNHETTIAKAFFFWSPGGHEGNALIDAADAWAHHMGASRLRIDSRAVRERATVRAYRMKGFSPVERVFERVL